jgi:hypothetical protein
MQEPLKPITTAIAVQPFPSKAKSASPGIVDPFEAKQRQPEELQPEQRQSETSGTVQGDLTLHGLIPPELLSIPQVGTSKAVALASYIANQGPFVPEEALTDKEAIHPSDDATNASNRQVACGGDARQDNILPIVASPSQTSMQPGGVKKASIVASYRINSDEPVYVAVPDTVIALAPQTSTLKSLTQNISDNVKSAYYRFMTMVPYSVGMLINVFA